MPLPDASACQRPLSFQLRDGTHVIDTSNKKILYVDPSHNLDVLREAVEAFQLPEYVYLVFWPRVSEESVIEELCSKLEEILHNRVYKKIILVIDRDNSISDKIILNFNSHEVFKTSVTFKDISKVNQEKLVKMKNIVFQGNNISIEELFGTQVNYDEVISVDVLNQLIQGRKIAVGRPLQTLHDKIKRYYIQRKFSKAGETISEEDIYNTEEKVVLISDNAGMGKSTILTKLAEIIKEQHPHFWIIRVDLNDYSNTLKHILMRKKKVTIKELLNGQDATKLNQFEETVFSMKKKVVLMLDGVDEISPDYTEIVLNFICQCQEQPNFAKIFVTTRPHVVRNLENNLKVKSFTLEPFNTQNQIDFLVNYWSSNLQITNKERCERYAKELMNGIHFSKDFAALPLQVRILAEIFQENNTEQNWQGCREYLSSNEAEPILTKRMDITELYSMFIESKKHIFLDKVNSTGNSAGNSTFINEFNCCLTHHRTLALEEVFNENQCKVFSCYQRNNNDKETSILRMGIIHKCDENINFVHRTFAEYFAAECILIELKNQNQNLEFQKFLIEVVLSGFYQFQVIRTFLNGFLKILPKPLPSNIFHTYYQSHLASDFNKNLLHSLAEQGLLSLLQLILNCVNFKPIRGKRISVNEFQAPSNVLKFLEFLVQRGGINIEDNYGRTPLHYAVGKGHVDMVRFLTEQGTDINRYIDILFEISVWFGYIDVVKFLVQQGARIAESHFVCCIYSDYFGKKKSTAKYLLDAVLEENGVILKESIVPYVATYLGELDILKKFIHIVQNVDGITATRYEETLCFGAVRGRQVNILKYLLEQGASVNRTNTRGETMLHVAVCEDCPHIVKILVEDYDVDINIRDNKLQTALHFAVSKGQSNTTRFLVEHKIDINVKDKYGRTALHLAASGGHSNIVRLLIDHHADINIKDNDGHTALHAASSRGRLDTVQFLVKEQNADINVKNNEGQVVTHVAASSGYLNILQFLIEELQVKIDVEDNHGYTELHWAVLKNHFDSVQFLVEKCNVDVGIKNKEGQTALHLAALMGYSNIVRLLVENSGADINVRDNKHQTPLHLATSRGRLEVVRFFVEEHNVDTSVKDQDGRLALHLAALWGRLDVIKFFVERKADVNAKDGNDCTPLDLAFTNKRNIEQAKVIMFLKQLNTKR